MSERDTRTHEITFYQRVKSWAGAFFAQHPESGSFTVGSNDRWLVLGVCIFLVAIVWVVFGQTRDHEFINFDDDLYVYGNAAVIQGLNLKGIEWAFTHSVCANWHPLTILSHMLDCQLYGLNAGGHHLTNVLLHTASVILLFLVLRRMTGFLWRSAFVAAVFAIHPLRVESVAWVAERKDVLSGLFFMLMLWAYVRYVQRRSKVEGRESRAQAFPALDPLARRSEAKMVGLWTLDYGLVLLFFALGLMCKPMLVTVPLVLLLLDYWPLGRLSGIKNQVSGPDSHDTPQISHLLLEKLPLFGLAVASCVVTILAQHEAIQAADKFSLPLRVGNASISYVAYLGQMFWPSGLAVLYPFVAGGVGVSRVVLSLVLLVGISAGIFVLRRQRPYFLTGWLWYLIMLVPVIGIVQVGNQARADRYTYLPQIGLYLLLAWAAADLCAGWRHRRLVLGGGSMVILMALIFCAREQTSYWRDGESLWTHTLACTSDNYVAHNNLGNVLLKMGQVDEAIVQYQKSLQIKSDYAEAHYNLGGALFRKGQVDEAIVHCQRALQIRPDYAEAHNNLGNFLLQKGDVDEAIVHFQKALQIRPDYVDACYNLGNALLQKGDVDEAIIYFQKTLQINPDHAKAHNNLGSFLLQKGSVDEAIAHFQKALQIKPDYVDAGYNLGNALLQKGDMDEAIVYFQNVLQIKPDFAEAHINLGMALLQIGDVDEAIVHFQNALQIKPENVDACYNLGNALLQKGDVDEAIVYFQKALQISPNHAKAHNNLGSALFQKGRVDEAIIHYQKALQIMPDSAIAHDNLGSALLQKGNVDEAIVHFQKALQISPDNAQAHNNLGKALFQKGDADEAIAHFQRALQIKHDYAGACYNLGNALFQKGRVDEAIGCFQQALQIKPDSLDVLNKLAWLLATSPNAHIRDGVQAIKYAERACELTHYHVTILVSTLAAAYAEAGRFDDAMATAQKACALAEESGKQDLLEKNQKLLELYRAHQPYREAAEKVVPSGPGNPLKKSGE